MLNNVKKVLLSSSIVILFALYAIQKQTQPATPLEMVAQTITTPNVVSTERSEVTSGFQTEPTVTGVQKITTGPVIMPTVTSVPPFTTNGHPSAPTGSSGTTGDTRLAGETYRNGSFTGTTENAYWGNVQVLVVIANGTITDVQFLQHPDHRSRSRAINEHAMPILIEEVLQSQQADVDTVTGATDTSEAFLQSLASALQEAAS